jgi:hypothetical protein
MGLLTRLMGKEPAGAPRRTHGFASDARAMRATLDGLHAELERVNGRGAPVDLRAMLRELLEGEVEAPTADIAELIRLGEEPDAFYEREVKPSWEGLGEAQRAARLEGFLELATMIDAPGAATGLPPGMVPRVHTKTLLLAWAFDETYGFISSLARADARR